MYEFIRKILDQNEEKPWKCKNFKKWEYQFNKYQKIPDEKRQVILLNYFKDAKVIPHDTTAVTRDLMRFIRDNPIISDPSQIGGHASHNKKRLSILRQCFTAEFLYVLMGIDIKEIDKALVMHNSNEEKESNRRRIIIEMGGNDFEYSTEDTPCLAEKRNKKRKANETLSNATPKSKEEKQNTVTKKLASGFKALMTPLQTMLILKKRPTEDDSDNNLASPKRRRFNNKDKDNDNLSRLISNTTKSPLAAIEERNEEPINTFFPITNEMSSSGMVLASSSNRYALSNGVVEIDHSSINSDVENGESLAPFTPNANQSPLSNDQELMPASSSESNSSPESGQDNAGSSSSVSLGDRQIRNIAREIYSVLERKTKSRSDMIRTLECIHRKVGIAENTKRSKEDEVNAKIVHNIKDTWNVEDERETKRQDHKSTYHNAILYTP